MKYIRQYFLKMFSIFALFAIIIACETDYNETEIYKKIIYIVDSENVIHRFEHPFVGAETEGFISVYCGGSRMPDEDVKIEIAFDEEVVDDYNFTEFADDTSRYVKLLNSDQFEIPSYNLTLKAGEPFVKMPIFVNPEGLSPDTTYVIPLLIKSTSQYEVNKDLSRILYTIQLKNNFTGVYRMTGQLKPEGSEGDPQIVFRDKELKPISEFTSRVFFAAESEEDENIAARTFTFTVNEDLSVTIGEENNVIDLGDSFFDPHAKMIYLTYSFVNESGVRYVMREKLFEIEQKN